MYVSSKESDESVGICRHVLFNLLCKIELLTFVKSSVLNTFYAIFLFLIGVFVFSPCCENLFDEKAI